MNVTADLAPGIASNQAIVRELDRTVFPLLQAEYPGLSTGLVGQQREMTESFGALGPMYVLALIVMFGMLAIPFRSYIQPLIVLGAFVEDVRTNGFTWLDLLKVVIAVLGFIIMSSVASNNLGRAAYRSGAPVDPATRPNELAEEPHQGA